MRDTGTPDAIATRIDQMPFSAWHVRLLALLGSAHLFDAFDATALAFVLPVLVGLWTLTPTAAGLLISASYAGQFAGAIVGGMLAERFGRINVLCFSLAVMALLSLACAFAPSYVILLLLRVVQGLGLGGETPIAATYMNETCPRRYRGKMVTAIQLMFASGAFAASILALTLIPRLGWRSMFVVGVLPLLIATLLRRLLPESPRWLAIKGRSSEAAAAVARIERAVFRATPIPAPAPLASALSAGPVLERGGIAALLSAPLLRPTLSAWLVAFCASIVGYGIIGWMPTIFRTVYHLPLRTSLTYGVATGVASLLGATLCILVIDKLGRKRSITLGFAGCAVCIGALAAAGTALSPLYVMIGSAAGLSLLALPLAGIYVYAPELYPTRIRALGMGVTSSWIRIASILGPPLIGVILTFGSVRQVYLLMCITAAVGAVAMNELGVDTTLEMDKI